ncbi:ABC transporter ATP-binding protein [candidate division WOR-3 bacterium]|nr:ABC transporter ATP-binding protein [candidate division WOR-3 bacterium]
MAVIEFNHIWKKFKKGGGGASLRDLISNMISRLHPEFIPHQAGPYTLHPDSIFWALKDVSFEVNEGEALGIIGPNGAGKTTILKLLSGIMRPTKGNINIKGKLSSLIELGAGFHPELTGRENIYLNGQILGMHRDEIKRKFDSIVDFSGIEEFLDMPVKRYSSGMYVRLGFAIAIHVDFDVLLVDEVLAVGDINFQKKCFTKMGEFREKGMTIVLISHSMSNISRTCNRAIFLDRGKAEFKGVSDKAIEAYYNSIDKKAQDIISTKIYKVGTGEVSISNVKVFQENNNIKSNEIEFGKNIVIEANYKINSENIPDDIEFRVGILTLEGYDFMKLIHREYKPSRNGQVQFIIKSPKLFPRTYKINIAACPLDMDYHMGGIGNAATFTIKKPDNKKISKFEYGNTYLVYFDYESKAL